MTLSVAEFDALEASQAAAELRTCCGSSAWVDRMVDRRPFGSRAAVLSAAEEIWRDLEPSDWLEAFTHHPRIGEQTAAAPQPARAAAWSSIEQSAMGAARAGMRADFAAANREYEERFGFIFIVCAPGKAPEEMLANLRTRLHHDRDRELRIAADEQRQITRLRLERLLRVS